MVASSVLSASGVKALARVVTVFVLFSIPWGKVFDAKQGREVDALAEELIDSAAVVKAAVARAVSLVQRFLLIG